MKKKILCTIGPTSFNERTLIRLSELGVDLLRINLSHTDISQLKEKINFIRRFSSVPICLDSEGAQIRTGKISESSIFLKENSMLKIVDKVKEEGKEISLYPQNIISQLKPGDLLSVDFDSVLLQVIVKKQGVFARVVSEGRVGNNKAVSCNKYIEMPAVTEKDKEAISVGKEMGISHFALSFANRQKDVDFFRGLVGEGSFIISKIESVNGYKNLEQIMERSNAVLIDRGDLSREVPIEAIPFYQKKIIEKANALNRPVYIATNLLESMTENSMPTRAEVNDVINALISGADGLVLAGETAIGKRPIETARMIVKLIKQYELSLENDITKNLVHVSSTLVEPHGGKLVNRVAGEVDHSAFDKIQVSDQVIMDAEQIGIGTYSPLEGFMNRHDIESVLNDHKLRTGDVWTLPIVCQQHEEAVRSLKSGQTVVLVNGKDNAAYALLEIDDIYRFPFEQTCLKWFGVTDMLHPGVKKLKEDGEFFVGGKITLLKRRESVNKAYLFTPEEMRHIFDSKGWSKVVGFHTRNVCHRVHEEIQRKALSQVFADGVLISPVIGKKKKGDFTGKMVLKTYQKLFDANIYDPKHFFLHGFETYARYSGGREAVFTAICRQNFGCSHFIMGRDHTGVGNFYAKNSSQELFDAVKDKIGIKPVFFNEINFCKKCNDYVFECEHESKYVSKISGTRIRELLNDGTEVPLWAMRKEVSECIIDSLSRKKEVFET